MQKIKLYWVFFRSIVIFNLAVSVILAFIAYAGVSFVMTSPPPFMNIYLKCVMFGGPLLCFYYINVSRKNEFYFFYNKGINKISLFIISWILFILMGFILLNIFAYAGIT